MEESIYCGHTCKCTCIEECKFAKKMEESKVKTASVLKQLHPVELAYFKAICRNPGGKYPMYSESEKGNPTQYTIDDGTEYGDIRQGWQKLEELGLVEAVGSYKWIPKVTYEELLESHITKLEARVKELEEALRKIVDLDYLPHKMAYDVMGEVEQIAEQALNKKS